MEPIKKQNNEKNKNKMKAIIPKVGSYYYPLTYEGQKVFYPTVRQIVKEDDLYYIFSDKSKHSKAIAFCWVEVPPPLNAIKLEKPVYF